MKARIGRHKVDRIEALPKVVRDIGWKAQVRLCTRYRRLRARQDCQRRQYRNRTRDGRLHLVDSLHDSIHAKGRRDHYLTDSKGKEIANTRSASARYAALGVGQCRGALVSTMSP
jgi:hypothetical protein